jgi:DNA primase
MDGLREILSYLQDCLPGSIGERYLKYRGISLEVAQNYGLGYAQEGEWPHFHNGRAVRQWKWGRLVFPHTSPDGTLVNLYGRAVGDDNSVPKSERHDHLPGNKAYFNAQTMVRHEGPLFVCEGTFDALTVLETTRERAVAIYGVHGWRREWCRGEDMVVIAFDNDPIGRSRAFELMRKIKPEEAVFPGIIAAETYGGEKDLNAALMKGCLQLGRYQQSSAA